MPPKQSNEKFWDRRARNFDRQTLYFAPPPVEKTKMYLIRIMNTTIFIIFDNLN